MEQIKVKQLIMAEKTLAEMIPKKLKNGRTAYRLYKVLKVFEEELKKFRELQKEILKEWEGKEITEQLIKATPELQEAMRKLEQAIEEEIPPPLYKFRIEEFEGMELSVQQVAALVELGVLEE